MVRPRSFDQNVVLDRAIDVFSRRGFEATTIQHLEAEMGLGRGSIYAAFGDKLGLFQAALDRYNDCQTAAAVKLLDDEPSGLQAIRRFFATVIEETAAFNGQKDCLITIASLEMAARDSGTGERILANLAMAEAGLARALDRARQSGEISSRVASPALARFLVNTVQGIKVRARVTSDRETLSEIAETALAGLG